MITVLLVILSLVTLAMIGCILLQQSEGGGLTSGGGAQSIGMMSARGAKNFLTRVTAVLATIFMALCIILAILGGGVQRGKNQSIVDTLPNTPEVPISQ